MTPMLALLIPLSAALAAEQPPRNAFLPVPPRLIHVGSTFDDSDWTGLSPQRARFPPTQPPMWPEDRSDVSICDVQTLSDAAGVVTSPGYPSEYPAGARCQLTLQAPAGGAVRLTCTEFYTQSCRRSYRDFLLIDMDGATYAACGQLAPFSLQTIGETMGLYFESDGRRQYPGFRCEYSMVNSTVSDGPVPGTGDGTCGIATNSSRIVGGEQAEIEEYPWMAALSFDGRWFCGGSLIADQWVMTAAHCTDGASSVEVRLGGTYLDAPGLAVSSTELFQHPDYDSRNIRNDIALIRLPGPVTFSDQIRPVCLPRESVHGAEDFAGKQAQISGWGRFSDASGSISSFLRDVTVPIISNAACVTWRPPSTQMCVDTSGAKSSCNGDSGGPLQARQTDGTFVEVGIVSYGAAAGCELGYPAAFTRVTEYLDYITQVTGIDLS